MSKITKRDMAILGAFLLVVALACGYMISRQVGGAASAAGAQGDDVVLASRPDVDMALELSPRSGLEATGEIADPSFFEDPQGFVATVSTRQPSPQPRQPQPGAGEPSGGEAAQGPQGPRPRPGGDPGAEMVSGPGEVTVYIAGLAGPSEDLAALVVHRQTGRTRWVSSGQHAFGYSIDVVTTKGAVLEKDGHRYVLELGEGRDGAQTTGSRSRESQIASGPQVEEQAVSSGDQSEEQKLAGRWTGDVQGMNFTFTFRPGGTGTMNMSQMPQPMDFSYTINSPGNMTIEMSMGGMTNSDQVRYRFENGGNTLVLAGSRMPGELRLNKG